MVQWHAATAAATGALSSIPISTETRIFRYLTRGVCCSPRPVVLHSTLRVELPERRTARQHVRHAAWKTNNRSTRLDATSAGRRLGAMPPVPRHHRRNRHRAHQAQHPSLLATVLRACRTRAAITAAVAAQTSAGSQHRHRRRHHLHRHRHRPHQHRSNSYMHARW